MRPERRFVHLGDLTDKGFVWDFGADGVTLRDLALCGPKQFVYLTFEEMAQQEVLERNLSLDSQVVRLPDGKPLEYAQPVAVRS